MKKLNLTAVIDIKSGGSYDSYNVIGEIKGRKRPDEIVLIGAHLDSWGLGTGALDNGCNVSLVIDLTRQIKRLGLKPDRTIRFALWNGEEQGMIGSWKYTEAHLDKMDNHIMASSYDSGSGEILGFFTNGRVELLPALDKVLQPVQGLGPLSISTKLLLVPITLISCFRVLATWWLIKNRQSMGPNYHARSDTFDLVNKTSLGVQMHMFEFLAPWQNGTRGISK